MGIHGLSEFLKKRNIVTKKYTMSSFHSYRLLIDANMIASKNYAGTLANLVKLGHINAIESDFDPHMVMSKWIEITVKFIERLLDHGITPVFIFDGEHPEEKKIAHGKRHAETDKKRIALEEIRATQDYRQLERANRILSQTIVISSAQMTEFRDAIYGLGIPCIKASAEGENLCTALAIEGIGIGVYSLDIDCLAMGCPLMLNACDGSRTIRSENGVPTLVNSSLVMYGHDILDVLDELDMTYDQFLDFCIMCGTDFNEKISGIGPVNAFKLIKQHGSFNNIIKNNGFKGDYSLYNYERTKNILNPIIDDKFIDYKNQRIITDELDIDIERAKQNIINISDKYNLSLKNDYLFFIDRLSAVPHPSLVGAIPVEDDTESLGIDLGLMVNGNDNSPTKNETSVESELSQESSNLTE